MIYHGCIQNIFLLEKQLQSQNTHFHTWYLSALDVIVFDVWLNVKMG